MLAAALLLVVLGVVSPPPPVACHGISRRSFVEPIPATMASEFDTASTKNYQAFGVITELVVPSSASAKTRKTLKRRCEGVLLSPRVVLTAFECLPKDTAASMSFEFLGDVISITHAQFKQANRYYLIELPREPKTKPTVYPFLSWFTDSQTYNYRYGIREDSDTARSIYVSSWLAHKSAASYATEMTSIDTALQNCQFESKDELIALRCSQLTVCKGKTVLSGSAFFSFTKTSQEKIVSVGGLVSLRSSGTFCKDAHAPGDDPTTTGTPLKPQCNDAYVCGRRFTQGDVKSILREARKLDKKGLTFHDDYIPSGTRSTSFVSS